MALESFLLRTLRPDFGSSLAFINGMFKRSTPAFLGDIHISNLTKMRE